MVAEADALLDRFIHPPTEFEFIFKF